MATLKVGEKAPEFALPAADERIHALSEFRRKKVILYFYPKDNTPGCTKEACSFRDHRNVLRKKGAVVVGISVDGTNSHKKFVEKYDLPFLLLSDERKKVVKAYGVWKEKSLYGKKFMGNERTTIIIDEQGTIVRIFPKVKVDTHVHEVLAAV